MARLVVVVLMLCACPKEPERQAQPVTAPSLDEGRAALQKGDLDAAVQAFKQAIAAQPAEARAYLLLAEAYQRNGNDTGAALTLKQGLSSARDEKATISRALADLYMHMGDDRLAAKELSNLKELGLLTGEELLQLALLQGKQGQLDEAKATNELARERLPLDAEVIDAELARLAGLELDAATRIDALLEKSPELTRARLWRASYFLSVGRADLALKDLELVVAQDAKRPEVLSLRATALNRLNRSAEAAELLSDVIELEPNNAQALALLAETRLMQGRAAEAQKYIDRAFGAMRQSPRPFYVRGRALELQGNRAGALKDYNQALELDPNFTPALSRRWRIEQAEGNVGEALNDLERLFALNELAPEERLALADLLISSMANLPLAKMLVDESLRREPKSKEWLQLSARLSKKQPPKPQRIEIIR